MSSSVTEVPQSIYAPASASIVSSSKAHIAVLPPSPSESSFSSLAGVSYTHASNASHSSPSVKRSHRRSYPTDESHDLEWDWGIWYVSFLYPLFLHLCFFPSIFALRRSSALSVSLRFSLPFSQYSIRRALTIIHCLETATDLCLFSCGHLFCNSDLAHWLTSDSNGDDPRCPVCERPCVLERDVFMIFGRGRITSAKEVDEGVEFGAEKTPRPWPRIPGHQRSVSVPNSRTATCPYASSRR